MTRHWRAFWDEVDMSLIEFEEAQVKALNKYLKTLRQAITKYAISVDPENFDDLGQPIGSDS